MAIRDAVQSLGIEVRAGLHTGECEVRGDGIGGIAVHIGARVSAQAGANEVLVSSTLRDLVTGSELKSKTAAHTNSRACPENGISSPSRLRRELSRLIRRFGMTVLVMKAAKAFEV
jgi:class 3 adenylate cyclase